MQAWDAEFVKVDQSTLFDLILAANYLNIKSLLDLTCQTVAQMIKGKTPEVGFLGVTGARRKLLRTSHNLLTRYRGNMGIGGPLGSGSTHLKLDREMHGKPQLLSPALYCGVRLAICWGPCTFAVLCGPIYRRQACVWQRQQAGLGTWGQVPGLCNP